MVLIAVNPRNSGRIQGKTSSLPWFLCGTGTQTFS